jgi:hypothetical protein
MVTVLLFQQQKTALYGKLNDYYVIPLFVL